MLWVLVNLAFYYRHIWSKSCWPWLSFLLPFSPFYYWIPNLQDYNRSFFFNPLNFASALLLVLHTTSWCIFLGLRSLVYIWGRLAHKSRLKLRKYFVCLTYTANILIVRTLIFYRVSFIIVISSYTVQWMAGYSQW